MFFFKYHHIENILSRTILPSILAAPLHFSVRKVGANPVRIPGAIVGHGPLSLPGTNATVSTGSRCIGQTFVLCCTLYCKTARCLCTL